MTVRVTSFCLVAAAFLAACETSAPASNAGASQSGQSGLFAGLLSKPDAAKTEAGQTRPKLPRPLAKANLAGGDVVVEGPEGYCIDPLTAETGRNRGFALIASCNILSSGEIGSWVEPALITVTVGPRSDDGVVPTPATIAEAVGATLLESAVSDGLSAAHLDKPGDNTLANGDRRYWRGAFVQGDRLVGLALYATKGSALAGSEGKNMLRRVHARIVAQSPSSGQSAQATNVTLKPKAVLGRLFNR